MQKFGKDSATNPSGTGPFQMKQYTASSSLVLQKFAGYWDSGKPYLDGVNLQILKDTNTLISALQAGTVDAATSVALADLERVKSISGAAIDTLDSAARCGWNLEISKPPFDDINLRQALLYATGFEDVIKVAYGGNGKLQPVNFWYPFSWGWYTDLPPIQKDVAKAKDFLSKAGKVSGFEFTLMTFTTSPDLDVLRSNLAAVGIKMNTDMVTVGDFSSRNVKGDFQAQYRNGGNGGTPSGIMDPGNWVRRFMYSKGPFASTGFTDPQIDSLMLQGETETDVNKRKPIYQQINKIWASGFHNSTTMYTPIFAAHNKKVNGSILHPDSYFHANDAWLS